jgi:hypothetical protein
MTLFFFWKKKMIKKIRFFRRPRWSRFWTNLDPPWIEPRIAIQWFTPKPRWSEDGGFGPGFMAISVHSNIISVGHMKCGIWMRHLWLFMNQIHSYTIEFGDSMDTS